MWPQEVKNCFPKYSNVVMKANNNLLIEQGRQRGNDKGGKLKYVPNFIQLLEDNLKEIRNTISERAMTRNLIEVQNADIRLQQIDLKTRDSPPMELLANIQNLVKVL